MTSGGTGKEAREDSQGLERAECDRRSLIYIVSYITVNGSRNGLSFIINFILKSEINIANNILIYINRFFDF